MKKADIFLGLAVITVCALLFSVRFFFQKEGASVVIEINGDAFGTYPLDEDREIDTGKGNRILIQDGYARMASATCPDHLCVHQGKIHADGEMIVCLPNRVTVQISDESAQDAGQPDVIAN